MMRYGFSKSYAIKKELRKAGRAYPALTEKQREEVVRQIAVCEIPARTRAGFGEFVKEQICFINKTVLFWHGVWFALFLLAVGKGGSLYSDTTGLSVLSMAPPLLCLCTVYEVAKIYCHGLLEIEYTTKYSLSKVVMLRMFLISVCTGIALLFACIPAKYFLGIEYGSGLVYMLTPMLCMSGCILKLMEKWQGEKLLYAAVAVYVGIAVFIFAGGSIFLQLYRAELFGAWLAVLLLAAAGNVFQVRRTARRLMQYEFLMEKA